MHETEKITLRKSEVHIIKNKYIRHETRLNNI